MRHAGHFGIDVATPVRFAAERASFHGILLIGARPLLHVDQLIQSCRLITSQQTKELFRKWLMYGIGTLFSIAMLYVVTSIVLYLTVNLAGALWSATVINIITGQGGEGYSSQAIQQRGIGLLMTVLIISVPPMASMFFNGTLGNFMPYAAFGAGAASQPGPQGQPPGSYGGSVGPSPQAAVGQANYAQQTTNAFSNNPSTGTYQPGATNTAQTDVVNPVSPTPYTGGTR
jgi:type IV secretion system protein VirB6